MNTDDADLRIEGGTNATNAKATTTVQ